MPMDDVRNATGACKPPPQYASLSYASPVIFPFPPWRIVLERRPGTCDLYGSPRVCRDFANGQHFEPEWHVREAIASLLLMCQSRPCNTLDIGMSTGYFTAAMASLGASVVAIERSRDMIDAFEKTKIVNCWADDRVRLVWGAIGIDVEPGATFADRGRDLGRPLSNGWGERSRVHRSVPMVEFGSLVAGKELALIKMDIDSIEARK
jgi:hypothetical protein